ncbi:SCO2584 family spore wall biosynthesis protein [Streptomyces lasiicapitis]
MPEDVGGMPSPDGWEPDDDRDHGDADEEFASVVFDEDFVRAAEIHEPTAVERLLAAAQARAEASEAESRRGRARRRGPDTPDDDFEDYPYDAYDGYGPDGSGGFGPDGGRDEGDDWDDRDDWEGREFLQDGRGRYGRRGAHVRWHRPVAWLLALLMGIGMVAFAFVAVYRGASSGRQDRIPPPATTEVEQNASPGGSGGPSASAEFGQPAVPAEPRTP